ncbi:hypothetical protein AB1N83_003450 [Pleurotus pulmonarius]
MDEKTSTRGCVYPSQRFLPLFLLTAIPIHGNSALALNRIPYHSRRELVCTQHSASSRGESIHATTLMSAPCVGYPRTAVSIDCVVAGVALVVESMHVPIMAFVRKCRRPCISSWAYHRLREVHQRQPSLSSRSRRVPCLYPFPSNVRASSSLIVSQQHLLATTVPHLYPSAA